MACRYPNETDEYRAQRDELLAQEVALRSQVEAVAAKRRELPLGGRLAKDYRFERMGPDGAFEQVAFADLFGTHDTLLLYSMMFGKEWDAPCPSCTSLVDAFNANYHPVARWSALAAVAAAPADKLARWAAQRGWSAIPLVSEPSGDYLLSYAGYEGADDPAMVSTMNVFQKTPDGIFHFWGSELASRPMDNGHPRHVDMVWPLWNLLDFTPGGRGDAPIPIQNYEHRYFTKNVMGG